MAAIERPVWQRVVVNESVWRAKSLYLRATEEPGARWTLREPPSPRPSGSARQLAQEHGAHTNSQQPRAVADLPPPNARQRALLAIFYHAPRTLFGESQEQRLTFARVFSALVRTMQLGEPACTAVLNGLARYAREKRAQMSAADEGGRPGVVAAKETRPLSFQEALTGGCEAAAREWCGGSEAAAREWCGGSEAAAREWCGDGGAMREWCDGFEAAALLQRGET